MEKVLKVSELTGIIKQTLEEGFSDIALEGEISNFKKHVSGHWYFTLKDSNAQISCTMWKGLNSYVFFTPENGLKVIVKGNVTVYPPRGNYQFDVRSMKPAGIGELQAAFEKLKARLNEEGLFDPGHKKPVPKFPERIGIVTAIGGAAFRDMISVAHRRYPLADLVISPAAVQGGEAAPAIAESIEVLNRREDIDTIIIGRGGGSLEDLWAFNEEVVARAVFKSRIPVISAVGHEIDFSISDFVADVRAATPTAAMEIATPSQEDIFAFIREFFYNSSGKIKDKVLLNKRNIKQTMESYGFRKPVEKLKTDVQFLDNLVYRINNNSVSRLKECRNSIELITNNIKNYDISKILGKGFALIQQNGSYVCKSSELNLTESFIIEFSDKELKVPGNG